MAVWALSVVARIRWPRVLGMSLVVFFQVLRSLESLVTDRAPVRFVGDVDADMGSYVVSLHRLCLTVRPVTLKVEIVR